jgi:hypothetical protein
VWWYIPLIPGLRKLRQEDEKFEADLGHIVRPCPKKHKQNITEEWSFERDLSYGILY